MISSPQKHFEYFQSLDGRGTKESLLPPEEFLPDGSLSFRAVLHKKLYPLEVLVLVRNSLFWMILTLTLAITGCDNENITKIAEAQHCLDTATPASAHQCREKVAGDESAQAYMIRCSARFLEEGFTTKRFVNAAETLSEDEGGGEASTVKALAIFKFNPTVMDLTSSECAKSNSQGMIQLAALSDLATFVVHTVGGFDPEEDLYDEETGEVKPDLLDTLKDNLQEEASSKNDEELGDKALALADILCTGDKADTSVCKDLDRAIVEAAGDSAEVGKKLRDLLAD